MKQPYSRISCILLALSLAIFTNYISNNLGSRFDHQREAVQDQHNTLAGKPMVRDGEPMMIPQFHNRILFPLIFELISRAGVLKDTQSYLLVRLLNALALFLTFLWGVNRGIQAGFKVAAAGAGMLTYAYVLTFSHGWEITSDYFDGIFTCLFLILVLERRRAALFAVVLLASFNRESAAFAGVLWFALHGVSRAHRIQWRESLYAAFLCVTSYVTVIAIRLAVLGRKETLGAKGQAILGPDSWWRELSAFLHHPTASGWPVLTFALLIPILLWLWINRGYIGETQARLLAAAGLIWAVTCFLGKLEELRVFIPALMILIFTAVWLEVLESEIHAGGLARGSKVA